MRIFFSSILLLIFSYLLRGQTLSNSVDWKGKSYSVFSKIYHTQVRVDPPDSLPDGHWIAYFENNKVAFTASYKNRVPDDTLKMFDYKEDRIHELFIFKKGFPIYYESHWYFREDDDKWGIEEAIWLSQSNDTVVQHYYNSKKIPVVENKYVIPKNEKYFFPFFRAYEGIDAYCVWTAVEYYDKKDNLKYRMISSNNKTYCYKKNGKKINCRRVDKNQPR